MSKKWAENLTSDERAELAKMVKPLRQAAGLTKKDVYDEAKISRQTLDNIENGVTVPQADVLLRVLDVVGYEIAGPEFDAQTETWLAMLGALIEAIPADRRAGAVDRIIRALALETRRSEGVVTQVDFGVGRSRKDLETAPLDSTKIAASKDNTPVDPSRGEK